MLFRFNQWQHTVLRKFMLEIPAWNMTILLYRVLSYLSRDMFGWLCHVKAKSHSIDKEDSTYLARKGHGAFQ